MNLDSSRAILGSNPGHSFPPLDRTLDFVALRVQESKAAAAYWASWQNILVHFTKRDVARVPAHWRTFGPRTSALTSSPRVAANPANAMLNYLYAILEAEARVALLAVGLDPGVGIQHADQRSRDSMACDVMEAVRPAVDRYLLDLLNRRIFQRTEFFETREGGCRLMPGIAADLSHTAGRWARCLGPVVEEVAETLHRDATQPGTRHRWVSGRRTTGKVLKQKPPLPTPLTETNRRKSRYELYGAPQPAGEGKAGESGGEVGRVRREIHIIVDNLSAHKTQKVRTFLVAHPNVRLHYTPTYSSWLNQVELWFSKIERDVIARGVFTSVTDLRRKLMRYIKQYNKTAKSFRWAYADPTRRIA